MDDVVVGVVKIPDLVAAAVAVWLILYAMLRVATRPSSVRPAPPSGSLRGEPPAVASLLVDRWRPGRDAVHATLLDLAARGVLELRQPGNDPAETTVRVGTTAAAPTPYEQQVVDRIRSLTPAGPVPLAALHFRTRHTSGAWHDRFYAEVVVDARRRGLCRRRFGPAVVVVLATTGIGLGAAVAALGVARVEPRYENAAFVTGLLCGLALAAYGVRYPGERDTTAGRAAAADWLGVRAWLRGQASMAYLPPAAASSNRYLPYATALGVAGLAASTLDIAEGSRTRVWSRYGGRWRRVRVRYPRLWPRYGRTPGQVVWTSLVRLAFGATLIVFHTGPRRWISDLDPDLVPDTAFDIVEPVALAAGVGLLALGAYTLVRALVDLATPLTLTGEVLWLQDWRSGDDNREAVAHLAVDDGTTDHTVAWALPNRLAGAVHDGYVVRITAYRWTRRVRDLTVVDQDRRPEESTRFADFDGMMSTMANDRTAAGAVRTSGWLARVAGWLLN